MDDLKSIIGKVATGATLSRDEAASAFDSMMSGEATPSQMGGFLMALRVRGETVDEITADTAPVISSTASPRTRSAIRNPPICEGVASPDIMLSKADAASSRDKVAPVATFPMIDLRSSITCFQGGRGRRVYPHGEETHLRHIEP